MKLKFFVIIVFSAIAINLNAQHSQPDVITAVRFDGKIKFDGILDDSIWQIAPKISNFTQRELDYGKPITEKTQVAVAYDKNQLYFAVWCYQDPKTIVAKFKSPDFEYESDDNFQIMISPFDDNRTGYLFVTNPNGARADILIFGGEDGNRDWNGVWDVRATVTDSGWFAEIIIPFNTLQFKKDENLSWALNFERDIVYKNEEALWQGWSRDNTIFAVVKAGRLEGLHDIAYAKRFEFKPYILAGWQYDKSTNSNTYPLKAGGDLNVYLSPTLKLNLTTFTDFAQVEADRIPVNLSRFSVYYPEKRQFFLEGSDLFAFYLGGHNSAFYSRQIGIANHQQVPIIAGARLFGKIKRNNIGFLNIQEAALDTIPTTNNTVFRYKRDIGKQSSVGTFFSNVINKNGSNQVIGFDATYQTAEFLGDKNLTISARASTSMENFDYQPQAMTYLFYVDYPNDLIDNFMAISSMQENYNADLGYIWRKNYTSYSWYFRIMPRWFTKYGVKRLLLKPWGGTIYRTQSTGELESINNEIRPLGAIFKSGERFEFNIQTNFDRLDEPFDLTDNISVPTGKYWMYQYEFQFETYHSRRIWIALLYNWGDFYSGKIKTAESRIGINFSKNFNLNGSYTWNLVTLPQGSVVTNEVASYLNYAFTTRLNLALFAQFNSLDNIMIYNLRLHWIPRIGSDLYFVYNLGYFEPIHQIDYLKPSTTGAVVKVVYRIMF